MMLYESHKSFIFKPLTYNNLLTFIGLYLLLPDLS